MDAYHLAEQSNDHKTVFLLGTKRWREYTAWGLTVEILPYIGYYKKEASALFARHGVNVDRIVKCNKDIAAIQPQDPDARAKLCVVYADINKLLPAGEERRMLFYVDSMKWCRSEVLRRRNYRVLKQDVNEGDQTASVAFECAWEQFERDEWKPIRFSQKKTLSRTDSGWQVDLNERDFEFWKKHIVTK